jgi:hypothetical protein
MDRRIAESKKMLVGSRFGRLTVIGETYRRYNNTYSVLACQCRCDCGNTSVVTTRNLRSGNTKSCGCGQRKGLERYWQETPEREAKRQEARRKRREQREKKRAQKVPKLENVYRHMLWRCYSPKCPGYKYYGGRGIGVCPEWRNSKEAFIRWSLRNGYAEGLSIDRIDNDAGYSPDNCRWTTAKVQNNNRRPSSRTVFVEYQGERKSLRDWSKDPRVSVTCTSIYARRKKGWSDEDALFMPPSRKGGRRRKGDS